MSDYQENMTRHTKGKKHNLEEKQASEPDSARDIGIIGSGI